jgi:hypothetical protein
MTFSSLLLILATIFPSASKTAWMDPDAFHLKLKMTRAEAVKALKDSGQEAGEGGEKNHLVVKFDDNKTLTLVFEKERLQSIRFELVDFVPAAKDAFSEFKSSLQKKLGKGVTTSFKTETILMYETTRPKVYVVFSKDPKSSFGKQGLAYLVVRYFAPVEEL